MILKLRNILPFTLATILFAACTDELPVERTQQQYYFDGDYYFVLEDENASMSRVQYDGIVHSEFSTGDRIGIFAPQNSDTTQIPNDVFSARDMSTDPPSGPHQVLVPCDDEIKKEVPRKENEYLLYFPYTATQSLARLSKGMSHTVKEDQNDESSFTASDLLWCHKLMTEEEKEAKFVTIHMHHAMATIVVKVAKDSIDTSRSVVLPSMPTQATGVILRKETEEVTTDNLQYNVETEKSRKDISMYKLPDDTDEYNYVYRAVVPACQTLQKDTDILTLHLKDKRGEYVETTYKLAQDVTLRPGKYYTFNLRAGQKPFIPDVGDDDSWVLEVYDPTDNKALVGYLCREYIYWEPENYSNYRDCPINNNGDYVFNKVATNLKGGTNNQNNQICMISTNPATQDLLEQLNDGGKYNMSITDMYPGINSQAWVFYNLKSGSKQPDLTKGTILRFVYDIKSAGGEPGYTPYLHPKYSHLTTVNGQDWFTKSIWPLPHMMKSSSDGQGIFKVGHGHEYTNTDDLKISSGDAHYGFESREYLEYYMHGGVITWDPDNNIIDKFFMPEEKISNNEAYVNGHIAIKKDENGQKQVFVSYTPCINEYEDEDGCAVGQREIKWMEIGGIKYPLRKVGFNQFWTGKSLYSTKDKDGNDLECFNTDGPVNSVNYAPYNTTEEPGPKIKYLTTEVLPGGYIYPCAAKGTSDYGVEYDADFDPYADESLRGSVALLYNMTAFTEGKLKPADSFDEEYRFPTMKDIIKLRRYGGVLFAAKWITDDVRTRLPDGTFAESIYDALKKGMLLRMDSYCSNISGLDFKAFGMRWASATDNQRVTELGVRNYFFIDATRDFPFSKTFGGNLGAKEELEKDPMAWIEIFRFSPWDCWGSAPIETNYRHDMHTINDNGENWKRAHSRVFAPIRVLMSFKNPIGNGASAAEAEYMRRTMRRKTNKDDDRKILNVQIIKSHSSAY